MKLGLISDTHGLLRDNAVTALRGCGLIVHAGDVGSPWILDALRAVAPVVAVRGNVDMGDWADVLPLTATAELDGARILVIHDVHELRLDPSGAGFQIVVSGHSYKPASAHQNGVLYLNPGAAGPRRFRLPITVATVDLEVRPWEMRLVEVA
jgi:putative phosphoesterase